MHTDEYTISLSRELAVCESLIRKTLRSLAGLEHRYGCSTREFSEKVRSGLLIPETDDFRRWSELAGSLSAWTAKREEYSDLLLKMRR